MTGVPDLGRLAAQAAAGPPDPLGAMVRVNTPAGPQQVPVTVGIFVMLDVVASELQKLNKLIEQIALQQQVSG